MHEASLRYSPTRNTYISKISEENENNLLPEHTGIVDSGSTYIYIAANAPHGPKDTSATKTRLGTANIKVATSVENTTLPIPKLSAEFPTAGYIMPTLKNTLIGIGRIYDANCTVVFKKQYVTVISP